MISFKPWFKSLLRRLPAAAARGVTVAVEIPCLCRAQLAQEAYNYLNPVSPLHDPSRRRPPLFTIAEDPVSRAGFSAAPSITIDHDTRQPLAYSIPQDNCGARKIVSSRSMAPGTTACSASLAAGSVLNKGHITPGLRSSPFTVEFQSPGQSSPGTPQDPLFKRAGQNAILFEPAAARYTTQDGEAMTVPPAPARQPASPGICSCLRHRRGNASPGKF